ncbi:MAG: hypothetical protein K0S48_1000 [Ramlibacter sp.]|nr:hypothetical protein [Ramlibacter sp.]
MASRMLRQSMPCGARSAARTFQARSSSLRNLSRCTLEKYAFASGSSRCAARRPITPQIQSRSSGCTCGPHLLSSCSAAFPASAVASLISARPTISRRTREAANTRLVRNRMGLAFSSASMGRASGWTISSAAAAALGRLASIDWRALRQASACVIRRGPTGLAISAAAAAVQPSSASRWPSQLRRTSSAIAEPAAGPSCRNFASRA